MNYTVPINGWPLGMDNIQPDYAVEPGALRSAANVDIFDGGKLRLRKGITSVAAAVGANSLWSDPMLSVAYYAAGGSIYSFSRLGVSTAVVTGLSPALPVVYHQVNGEVFWSNTVATGRFVAGVNRPWGLETPASQPVLAATTGGLEAGTYQIAVTYRNAAGEESGAQNAVAVTLAAVGGVAISALPVPVDASITLKNIYMTLQNGDVLYKVATIAAAQATYTVATAPAPTVVLKTQDFTPMPAGSILAHRNGQIFSAVGPYVFYSEPMRYGLHNPLVNFYTFPTDVSVMLSTPDGLYVCADKTYFITNPGTPEAEQKVILPFGAAAGTGVYLTNGTDVAWFSHRGQVIASGGQAKVTTEKHFAPAIMSQGASLVREQQGLRQIINVVAQSSTNSLEFTGV